MPNRIIKESTCTSETIDQMSWFEECFFHRLWVNCDDYGRMDARPAILKAKLFPLKARLSQKEIQNALMRLSEIGCIHLYTYDGNPFLYIPAWESHQNVRAKRSKYPSPDDVKASASTCMQMQADADKCPRNPIQSVSESESLSESNASNAPPALPASEEPDLTQFNPEMRTKITAWLQYKREKREPYKATGLKSLISQIERNVALYGNDAVGDLIGECMANNWQGIIWDRLKKDKGKAPPGNQQPPKTKSFSEIVAERMKNNANDN